MRSLRVATLFSVALSLPCWADPTLTLDQLKLTGIAAYDVIVDTLTPAAIQCGISEQQLKTQAELTLRKNSIPLTSPAPDSVHVALLVLFNAQVQACFYSLAVQVRGLVQRDLGPLKAQRIRATIWERKAIALAPKQEAPQHARELLAELLDTFCNDHLAANPRGSARR